MIWMFNLRLRTAFCTDFGRDVSQVVLPIELRERMLKLAHEAVMSGHQGRTKTKDRIWNQFWWPGLNADVTRFCRSCDICQRRERWLMYHLGRCQ